MIDTTQAVRIKTVVTHDGVLNLHGPFRVGDNVEVIVLSTASLPAGSEHYPLRGTAYTFIDSFDSVAEDEWTAAA